MTARDLAHRVREMRDLQKAFFAGDRSVTCIARAKSAERRVDAAVREILDGQGRLDLEPETIGATHDR